MQTENVLIIDDDTALCDLLTTYLAPEGFRVDSINDGHKGLEKCLEGNHNLLILDVILPVMNGFEVLRHLRKVSDIPVIILTGRGDDIDRIVGLEIGADDSLSKPFNPRELLARMRAILRRVRQKWPVSNTVFKKLRVGDVELDTGTRLVFCNGKKVRLTSVEFNLLETLLRRAGQLVSREDLTQTVLCRPSYPNDRSIDVHVSKLRKKLGHMTAGTERIKTIRNAGYLYISHPGSEPTLTTDNT
jgi:two-component system response regulator CpxR